MATPARHLPAWTSGSGGNSNGRHGPKPTKVSPDNDKKTGGRTNESSDHRMTVEKGVVDELLLVCGVIGTTTNKQDELVPVTDCLNWLQDLQRALRRDDDTYRPISLLMGKWRVVEQKLLPLVLTCRYDTAMVLTIVKILVILTKPLTEVTKRAGRMVIDVKNKKIPPEVIKEQIRLRDNALAQSDMLMEYKRIMTQHSSHQHSSKHKSEEGSGGLISIFVSLLADPLSRTGTSRSDLDHLTIELVLHLFRNLLTAEPLLTSGSIQSSQRSHRLHQELTCLFESELVFEILVVIAQEMESRENANYNLLMMELLHHLLRHQDPTIVARSIKSKKELSSGPSQSKKLAQNAPSELRSSLREALLRDKQKFRRPMATRHSNFGGTLVKSRSDGRRQYVSAAMVDSDRSTAGDVDTMPKKKNRNHEPFVGMGKTMAAHTRGATALGVLEDVCSPMAVKAQLALHNFCKRFVQNCYGPLMKSIKNEFRRDSVRLEEGDQVVFFRIIWFFCQWWRVSGGSGSGKSADHDESDHGLTSHSSLGHLIFTMDVFTFNLVLNATDSFLLHKKYPQLAQAVAVYREMTNLLVEMYRSKDDTENIMALGLMDRLFYGSDPLDRLPKLMQKWTPGTSTREYLCDLVEIVHVTLKLLELNAKACEDSADADSKGNKTKRGKQAERQQSRDAVTRMKLSAAEFDVSSYFARKLVSNQVVSMYTHLLSQYAVNSVQVNHHLVAFLWRLSKFTIVSNDDEEDYGYMAMNELATKTVTLEPMLYNIHMILVLHRILNDPVIRKEKDYESILALATKIISNFAIRAEENPLLYVECLFKHPAPHRFCELTTNLYVDEELRMIAEREILLREQNLTMMEQQEVGIEEPSNWDDIESGQNDRTTKTAARPITDEDDEDEELEWDEGKSGVPISNGRINIEKDDEEQKPNADSTPATTTRKRSKHDSAGNKQGPSIRSKRLKSSVTALLDSSDEEDGGNGRRDQGKHIGKEAKDSVDDGNRKPTPARRQADGEP